MCEYWAVNEFGNINDVRAAMQAIGYRNIEITEISWHVFPSMLFVPLIASKYFFMKVLPVLFKDRQKWNHFMASVYSMVVGGDRMRFGYYLISAMK